MKSISNYVVSELVFLGYQVMVIMACKFIRIPIRILERKLLFPLTNYPFTPFIDRLGVWRRRYNRLVQGVQEMDQKLNILHKESA